MHVCVLAENSVEEKFNAIWKVLRIISLSSCSLGHFRCQECDIVFENALKFIEDFRKLSILNTFILLKNVFPRIQNIVCLLNN